MLGKILVRKFSTKTIKYKITETEAYCGEEDLACHASKGKTSRTKVMYKTGGVIYVYLVYGMHWMLNIVAANKDQPEAVLIRGLEKSDGPGKVGKELKIDKSFYGEDLTKSRRLWVEEPVVKEKFKIKKAKRIGVDYAGKWSNKPWRFILSKP